MTNIIGKSESMKVRIEVELDIFSGMPNPKWILTNDEVDIFMKKLGTVSRISATRLSGNLGYRGFIVKVTQGSKKQLIHIQTGIVQISMGITKDYAKDNDRDLERWLLTTGRPYIKNELFQDIEVTFR